MMNEEEYDSDTSDEDYVAGHDANEDSCDDSGASEDEGDALKKSRSNIDKSDDGDKKKEQSLEDKQKEKERKESLFADFLSGIEDKPVIRKKSGWSDILGNSKPKVPPKTEEVKNEPVKEKKSPEKCEQKPQTVTVTKVFEFAGEEIRVDQEVSSDSLEAKESKKSDGATIVNKSIKRPGAAGLLDMLQNKKKKLTTLEKTKLDWNSFKKEEDIEEELEGHKKSKSGYLEKVAFLERADHRQFEIERDIRMNNRSKR